MSSMTWDDVALYYGTDKSSLGHGYMSHYQGVLGTREVHSVLEVGVADGASVMMWADLFPDAKITGLDISPVGWTDPENIKTLTVNASNRHDVDQALGLESFDLIVDDGSHSLSDVTETLGVLAGRLSPNGVYAIEDTVRGRGGSFADTDDVIALLPLHGLKPLSRTRSQREGVSLIMAVVA